MSGVDAGSELEVVDLRPDVLVSNRYRVEALLGQGGAASVYRVRDARSGQRVALKQLRLQGGRQDALLTSQFEREYHTLSELAHPSIIEVYDYGVEHSGPYYTMELLDGEDMRERGQLPFREVCALLCDVASSLAIVHSRNRVHRDVSARNVRCTRQGHAKLIDFGAMATTGKAYPLVGTPPFVPPEALQLQPLDGRVDLYALGALAYFMLTGRHAYAADSFGQLRDLWRSAPPTLRQYDSSVPEALDRLVLELLQLERAARPRSAAEVMERLSGIAGLPLQELPEVQRAYLAVPMLVGREAELKQVRNGLVTALQGRGSSVLIEGAAGVGRSRMLDACVLEAKLMGAVVLRAGAAGDGHGGEYGLVRGICNQLQAAMPVLAEQSARPRRALLAHVLAPLARGESVGGPPPLRRQLQAALRDFFLAMAREQLIVIAVDDIQLADEASAALLGLLAHGAARRRLCLLVTAVSGGEPSQVLALLRQVAPPIALVPLGAEQTRTLVKSLFGDIEHVAPLSDRIHALSEGNPRWVMTLCERLLERGIARYHAGRWTLPAELGPDAVPSSLSAELAARIDALPADARELAETLALSDPAAFSLPDYTALSQHADRGRTYRALDALVAAGVLVAANDRYQFSQPEFARLLQASVTPERARFLHERLASLLSGPLNSVLHAHHLLLAGRPRDAVETVMSQFAIANWQRAKAERNACTLASALEQQSDLSLRRRLEATQHLLATSVTLGRLSDFLKHVPTVLERLSHDSGLSDYVGSTAGTLKERAKEALQQAAQRYSQTPAELRVFSPQEALQRLLWLGRSFVGMGSAAQDLELLERMPSLAAFIEMHPALGVAQEELGIQREMQSGRPGRALAKSLRLMDRLRWPAGPVLDPLHPQSFRMAQLYLQGLVRAGLGIDVPAELLAELEQAAGYRAQAWRVRMASEFVRCNFDEARACERRAALIGLQDGTMLPGTTVRVELLGHVYADNLTGVQRSVERTEDLAARYPGWRSTHAIARCHYLRLQGDLEAALLALQPALELTRAGRHTDWALAAQSQIQVLTALGRADEAVACGRRAADQARAADVVPAAPFLIKFAVALLAVGDVESAQQVLDGVIAELTQLGSRGLHLGAAFEARARVAIATRDLSNLHQALERCAAEFKVGENSVMNARHERLLREALAAGMELPASAHFMAAATTPQSEAAARTVYSRMLTCIGSVERAKEALRLLMDAGRARSGYLFGLRGGQLKLLANVDETEAPEDLTLALEEYLRSELEDQERSSHFGSATQTAEPLQPWIDSWGREFEPLLLVGAHEGESVIAGIAALHHEADERPVLERALLQALTEALIAEDIIDPITCVG